MDEVGIEGLHDLIVCYLDQMDQVQPGPTTIFKTYSSQIDLETKIWHYYHKIEATSHHTARVVKLSNEVRNRLKEMVETMPIGLDKGTTEISVTLENREILFEIDAFFAAARSSLDFLASIISRYIKGLDIDTFKRADKILGKSSHAVAKTVKESWANWAEDLVTYRDHLLHRGVLPTTVGTHVMVTTPGSTDSSIDNILSSDRFGPTSPIVFPLPLKPNPKTRITRLDASESQEQVLPTGVVESTVTVRSSTGGKLRGITVTASQGRTVGPITAKISSEISLSGEAASKTVKAYHLETGYVEGEALCRQYLYRLLTLGYDVINQLMQLKFSHIDIPNK